MGRHAFVALSWPLWVAHAWASPSAADVLRRVGDRLNLPEFVEVTVEASEEVDLADFDWRRHSGYSWDRVFPVSQYPRYPWSVAFLVSHHRPRNKAKTEFKGTALAFLCRRQVAPLQKAPWQRGPLPATNCHRLLGCTYVECRKSTPPTQKAVRVTVAHLFQKGRVLAAASAKGFISYVLHFYFRGFRHGGTRPRPRCGQPAEDKHLLSSSTSKGSMGLDPLGSNARYLSYLLNQKYEENQGHGVCPRSLPCYLPAISREAPEHESKTKPRLQSPRYLPGIRGGIQI